MVSTRLSVTLFHIAMLAMSLFMMLAVGTQVLYGATDAETVVVPTVGAAFFTVGYLQARYLSRFMGRSAYRGWAGGPEDETEELFAAAFRQRAWILAVAIVPPVLVLVAHVVAPGILGTPADLPADADWG